jgi:hypothetical protein
MQPNVGEDSSYKEVIKIKDKNIGRGKEAAERKPKMEIIVGKHANNSLVMTAPARSNFTIIARHKSLSLLRRLAAGQGAGAASQAWR